MIRGAGSIAIAAALSALAAPVTTAGGGQAQFRSGTTLVSVSVSVRGGNVPVKGLTPADFVLTDNGIPQRVSELAIEAVPIDVTLILDTSGSAGTGIEQLASDARDIAALLRPVDRFRLLTIDTYVHEIVPMQPAVLENLKGTLTFNGASAVHDALTAALIRRVDPDRRHLIVAMTDAVDTNSVLTSAAVRDVARRSDAVLHLVLVQFMTAPPPVPRNWLTHRDHDLDALRDAAESTGGQLRRPGLTAVKVVREFREVFDEFRESYVLRYTPTGVAASGWHTIDVMVPASPRYRIRARKGYFGVSR